MGIFVRAAHPTSKHIHSMQRKRFSMRKNNRTKIQKEAAAMQTKSDDRAAHSAACRRRRLDFKRRFQQRAWLRILFVRAKFSHAERFADFVGDAGDLQGNLRQK